MPASGRAPCEPRPVTVMSKNAPPAIIGPGRIANLPSASPACCACRRRCRREALEQLVVEHGLGAAQTLLGRLEDEMHGAVEVARLGQVARRARQHGRVPVVPQACILPACFDL
jgi:hypothetical protein